MKSFYENSMANAAFALFLIALFVFGFTLLSALSIAFSAMGSGIMVAFAAAFQSAALPFFGAAFLFRFDKWLEKKG
jgi:hypothetical protein